jgi:hypothetical protein
VQPRRGWGSKAGKVRGCIRAHAGGTKERPLEAGERERTAPGRARAIAARRRAAPWGPAGYLSYMGSQASMVFAGGGVHGQRAGQAGGHSPLANANLGIREKACAQPRRQPTGGRWRSNGGRAEGHSAQQAGASGEVQSLLWFWRAYVSCARPPPGGAPRLVWGGARWPPGSLPFSCLRRGRCRGRVTRKKRHGGCALPAPMRERWDAADAWAEARPPTHGGRGRGPRAHQEPSAVLGWPDVAPAPR